MPPRQLLTISFLLLGASPLPGQEPVYHTFSIAAIDPATGESGVAVTTRVVCVGNIVPWVRAGVGAVATQAYSRAEYGPELLAMMADGLSAPAALDSATGLDERAAWRQVGAIRLDGTKAQHTGDSTDAWTGHRAGAHYVTQGNLLSGPEVLAAVATTFEASEGSGRHLADRLIEALAAGQAAGGDARKGRAQSAAVVVADPREGRARRPDQVTTNINVCEHPTPVAELRRVWNTISETLGYRTLEQFAGRDIVQLRIILHELGYLGGPDAPLAPRPAIFRYDQALVDAVDAFRRDQGLSTPAVGSPPGLVDSATVARLWQRLAETGRAAAVRERLRDWTDVRR